MGASQSSGPEPKSMLPHSNVDFALDCDSIQWQDNSCGHNETFNHSQSYEQNWYIIGQNAEFIAKIEDNEQPNCNPYVNLIYLAYDLPQLYTPSVLCREHLWVVVELKRRYRNSLNE